MKTARLCILALVAIASTSPANPQQKSPAQPTQAQLQEQIDELKKRLDETELKAKTAELERDYVTRVQRQYETYYEKVLSTQTLTVTIVGIFITVLLAIAARIGFNTFERLTQSAIREATTQLEAKYNQTLAAQVQNLKESNDTEMKSLSDSLQTQIAKESGDLKALSRWNLQVAQAVAFDADKSYDRSADCFRKATEIYKKLRDSKILEPKTAAAIIANTLIAVGKHTPNQKTEKFREELSNPLYDGLENELALAAVLQPDYAKAINERQKPTPAIGQPQATPAQSPPAEPV